MAGIVNKSNRNHKKFLLRPVEKAWEVWAMDENPPRMACTCSVPAEAQASPQSVLAMPLRQLFAVPLWLATKDPALMRDMILLQLERRGLAGRSPQEAVFDYRTVRSTETQTLVLAVALPGALPEELCLNHLSRFEPSARTQPLPPDELVLWREEDRLVLAATSGREMAYFQALGGEHLTESVIQELLCVKLQLEANLVVDGFRGLTVWDGFSAAELSKAGEALNLPVKNAKRTEPALPEKEMDLIPVPVRQAHRIEKAGRRKKKLITTATAIYLGLLGCLALYMAVLRLQCNSIETELKRNQSLLTEIRSTAQRWDSLEKAISPESYPVELLLRCSRLLPANGVRFTLFSIHDDRISIQGEAKDAPSAFKFAEDLKRSKDLRDYHWQMPQPRILPNDNAEFQIEGTRPDAKID